MATAGSLNEGTYLEELKERFLVCCICQECFDEEGHHPRLLDCLHSICFDCLKKIVKNEQVECPLCKCVCKVPKNDVENVFSKDNTRRDLLDFVNVRRKPAEIPCSQCDKPAVSRCSECKDFLCELCTNAHKITKMTRGHRVEMMEALQELPPLEFNRTQTCTKSGHERYNLDLFCARAGCQSPICTLCALVEHKEINGHKVEAVNEVHTIETKKTSDHLDKTIETQKHVVEVKDSVKKEIHSVEQREMDVKHQIKAAFESCIKMLQKRQADIIKNLEEATKAKVKTLTMQQEEMHFFEEELRTSIQFSDQALKNYSPTAFLQIYKTVNERLQDLCSRQYYHHPEVVADFDFKLVKMGGDFNLETLQMGDLWFSNVYPPNTTVNSVSTGREKQTALKIKLFQVNGRPVADTKVDVKVTVLQEETKDGHTGFVPLLKEPRDAPYSSADKCFLYVFQAPVAGRYRVQVHLAGHVGKVEDFQVQDDAGGATGGTDGGVCTICMEAVKKPKTLQKCKHTFCTDCIDRAFKTKPQCPVCEHIYGTITGNQPKGTFKSESWPKINLPGYGDCGCITIEYNIPDGIQAEDHPNPGKPYYGTKRKAYLPDNKEGRRILKLLKIAFDRGLVFTVGKSQTTGQDDVVVWNDLHHKTRVEGGPAGYGYPDPDYLQRVEAELAAKGVVDDNTVPAKRPTKEKKKSPPKPHAPNTAGSTDNLNKEK